jgi:hypothetical protein
MYQSSINQNVLYQPNQTLLSRPVKLPKRLVIKFSAIQAKIKIKKIQV